MGKYFSILFICFATQGNCQSNCDCFDRLYQLSNYQKGEKKSVDMLKDAISFLDSAQKGEYYWQVAQSYSRMKQYDSSAVWYEKAVEWGYDIESLKWYSKEVYDKMNIDRLQKLTFEHRKKINFELYRKFAAQLAIDQAIRSNGLISMEKYRDTSVPVCAKPVIDSLYQDMFNSIDDSTFRFLKQVFNNYGFPTFHNLGFFPGGIGGMIFHVTARRNENAADLLNKLEEFTRKCEYRRSDILALKDRQKYLNDGKTYSGLFGPGDRFLNIEDIDKADSIRFAYNRVRLEEEAVWGNKLPGGYKPRPYPKNYFCLKKYEIK